MKPSREEIMKAIKAYQAQGNSIKQLPDGPQYYDPHKIQVKETNEPIEGNAPSFTYVRLADVINMINPDQ